MRSLDEITGVCGRCCSALPDAFAIYWSTYRKVSAAKRFFGDSEFSQDVYGFVPYGRHNGSSLSLWQPTCNELGMPATVWKGYVTFGLVSFPVRLYSAARAEAVHFHLLHKKDLSRVKEVMYCAKEDKPLDRDELVKGFEYEKGQYVVVEPEELKKIAPATATAMEILQFVRMDEVDPIFLETSYYMAPESSVARPYSLLFGAMKQTGYDALAKLTMHNREHIVILRPAAHGIVLHTMYFVDELHAEKDIPVPKAEKFDKKELELAKKLIETLAAPFKPEQFHDEYKQNVEKLIEAKRKGRKVTPITQPKKAPVIDLMKALQQSLAKSTGKSGGSTAKKTGRKRTAAA